MFDDGSSDEVSQPRTYELREVRWLLCGHSAGKRETVRSSEGCTLWMPKCCCLAGQGRAGAGHSTAPAWDQAPRTRSDSHFLSQDSLAVPGSWESSVPFQLLHISREQGPCVRASTTLFYGVCRTQTALPPKSSLSVGEIHVWRRKTWAL